MSTDPTPSAVLDFDGCHRACRKKGEHTLHEGCEFAPPPPPQMPVVWESFIADDGHVSMRTRDITWEEALAMVAPKPGLVDPDTLAIPDLTEEEQRDFLDSPDVRPVVEVFVNEADLRAAVDAARHAERALIADELLAWAWEADEPVKRQLRAASLRIAPELTADEMRTGLAALLAGMRGRNHA